MEQPSPEPEIKVFIPMHKPSQISECKKCGMLIAEPKELIRITKTYGKHRISR